jgi:cytochrome c-type biogenesis protein CcmH/NrfG
MKADSVIVEEVRKRAHEVSQRFSHDLRKYAQHLHEVEREHAGRIVNQVSVVKSREPAPDPPVRKV